MSLAPSRLDRARSMPLHILRIRCWGFGPKDCIPTFAFFLLGTGDALEGDGPAHRGGVTPGREGAAIVASGALHKLILPFRMRSWECPICL
jgi:hypothetical protein